MSPKRIVSVYLVTIVVQSERQTKNRLCAFVDNLVGIVVQRGAQDVAFTLITFYT